MRALVILLGLVTVARVAAAEPEMTCYVGTQVETIGSNESKQSIVALRVVDRAHRRITQTLWTDRDAERAITHALDVDPEHGTFTFADAKLEARGTGTLEGKPWQWTGYRATIALPKLGIEMTSEAELGKGQLVVRNTGSRGGKPAMSSRLDATAIDCKQLDARRAALARVSASATHACYEGTSTTVGGPTAGKHAVVVEQVVDAKTNTIELRHWSEDTDGGRPIVLAIKGEAIVVGIGGLKATGTIAGKAGAWTDYTWTMRVQRLDVTTRGTLGGAKVSQVTEMRRGDGKAVARTETVGTAFDCAKLPERRAAVAATKPIP